MTISQDRKHHASAEKHLITSSSQAVDDVAAPLSHNFEDELPTRRRNDTGWLTWENFRIGIDRHLSAANFGWKPLTLKGYFLGAFLLFSMVAIIILEVLAHISIDNGNNGGLLFAEDVAGLPHIAVSSWVDLDVKRLEAWFQLSKNTGATAKDSLLLQYPFDFLPLVPLTAFRRKHWNVFFAGTIMLIVFWVITPLISAIFTTGVTTRSISTMMHTSSGLAPFGSQKDILNSNFLNTAYGISWLGQKLPPFTTSEFALLPFQPLPESPVIESRTQSWASTAIVYNTSLDCSPAEVEISPSGYTFDNGRGCSVELSFSSIGHYTILYIGYHGDPRLDWSLENPNCTSEHANNFLALWASEDDRTDSQFWSRMTAIFCRTKYDVQESLVTVNASDHAVVSREAVDSRRDNSIAPLADIFNITHFEFLVGAGVRPVEARANYHDTTVVEQYSALLKFNLTWPATNAVGFAMGLTTDSVESLENPIALQSAFEKAHRVLFAAAFNTLARNSNTSLLQDIRPGTIQGAVGALIMVRTISIVVEIAFGLIIVMVACLWCIVHRRQSLLDKDPASIADVMSLLPSDEKLEIRTSNITEKDPFKYRIDDTEGDRKARLYQIPNALHGDESQDARQNSNLIVKSDKDESLGNIQPVELQISLGITLVVVLSAALGAVIFLDVYSNRTGGISLPSRNPIVLTIIENYVPTIFATLLEPVWVVLNRILCLLQPFDELRKGNATSQKSIGAKYTSLPPQLVVWRAARSGHLILATVCLVAISINILAVALSALIDQRMTNVTFPMMGARELLPSFNGQTLGEVSPNNIYYDHFYALMSNITEGTPLPPWVDTSHFYMPVELRNPKAFSHAGLPLDIQEIQGSTTGFGVDISCSELFDNQSEGERVVFEPDAKPGSMSLNYSQTLSNGTRLQCGLSGTENFIGGVVSPGNFSRSVNALELMHTTTSPSQCSSVLLAGWVRLDRQLPVQELAADWAVNRSLTKTFVSCTPRLTAAAFDVLVDTEGHILKSRRTSDFSADTAQYFINATAQELFYQRLNQLMAPRTVSGDVWHNDSFTSDYMNSIIGLTLGSDRFVNPSDSVPNAEEAIAVLKPIYTQLSALLLAFNTFVFTEAPEKEQVPMTIVATEPRIFLSPVAFKMTVVLLCLQLIVAVLYYTNRPKRFLSKMPTSIAAIISFVSASRALEDFSRGGRGEEAPDQRYAYGRFVGTDGKTHVGIEKQRYVVPLKSRNPEVRRRRGWIFWKGRKDEREVKNWI